MDHQGLAAGARRADMRAETLALPLEVTRQSEIIEPRFANGDYLGMVGERDQFVHCRLGALLVVRMNAHRSVDIGMRLGERTDLGEFFQFDPDTQCMAYPVLGHVSKHLGQLAGEVREIDMAVRVDEHAVASTAGVLHGVRWTHRF